MVVALVTSYGISRSVNNSNTELSDLTLANLEALADGESGGTKTIPCQIGEGTCTYPEKLYNGTSITITVSGLIKCPICL